MHVRFGLEEKESWNDWFGNPVRSKLSAVITIYRCATGLPLTLKKLMALFQQRSLYPVSKQTSLRICHDPKLIYKHQTLF